MTIHIKKFLDKMAVVESKSQKDVVLSMSDARGLRDDIARLLADLHDLKKTLPNNTTLSPIEIRGGTFK